MTKPLLIVIEVIPHEEQRYCTCGDWFYEGNALRIKVSRMGDWRHEALVAIHELVEVLLCRHDGVPEEAVDKFDFAFEAARQPGNDDEPGDDPQAPYRKQHCFATGIERLLAAELGIDWKHYEQEINRL
jgi:hypothetical protein